MFIHKAASNSENISRRSEQKPSWGVPINSYYTPKRSSNFQLSKGISEDIRGGEIQRSYISNLLQIHRHSEEPRLLLSMHSNIEFKMEFLFEVCFSNLFHDVIDWQRTLKKGLGWRVKDVEKFCFSFRFLHVQNSDVFDINELIR